MARPALRRCRRWTAALAAAALAAAALAAAVAPLAVAHAQGSAFTSLVVFGDSFSDPGNAFQLTGGTLPPSPPYAPGRVSNGLIWVEYLAPQLGLPAGAAPAFLTRADQGSYAVATARTLNPPGSPPLTAPSTADQVGSYLTRPGGASDPTGLYVLFGGANDLGDAGSLASDAARRAAAQAAAMNLGLQAGALAASGAGSILLPFLPDVGLTPEALAIPGRSPILSDLTGVFNAALAGQLTALRATFPTTTFYELHLDNLFTNVLLDARDGGRRYGITNVSVPCLAPFVPPGVPVPSCDESIFVDPLHPTTVAHALIADAMYDRVVNGVDVQVVPEPSTIALVGGGLLVMGLGAARRRRAAA